MCADAAYGDHVHACIAVGQRVRSAAEDDHVALADTGTYLGPATPLASVQWDGTAVLCSVTIMTGLQAAQACMQWRTTRWS